MMMLVCSTELFFVLKNNERLSLGKINKMCV